MSFLINPYSFAAAGASDPTGITSIWDWWEVSRQGLADTDPISTLVGQANGRNFTEANGANQPSNSTNQINSLSAIRFAGSPRAFGTGPDMSGITTGAHFFALLKRDNDPALDTARSGWGRFGETSGGNQNDHFPYTDGNLYASVGINSRLVIGDPIASLTNWTLIEVKIDGTTLYEFSVQTTAGSRQVLWNTINAGGLGFATAPLLGMTISGFYMVGYWAHLALYSAPLSAGNRTAHLDYMNTRFATSFA